MTLYNCKSEGDEYRITKFDSDLNVESTYLTTLRECQCPAGHRDTCRHRLMLPMFLNKRDGADRGAWLLDYDRKQWVRASTGDDRERSDFENEVVVDEDEVEIIEPNATMHNMHQHMGGVYAKDVTPKPINLLSLAEPAPQPKPLRRI